MFRRTLVSSYVQTHAPRQRDVSLLDEHLGDGMTRLGGVLQTLMGMAASLGEGKRVVQRTVRGGGGELLRRWRVHGSRKGAATEARSTLGYVLETRGRGGNACGMFVEWRDSKLKGGGTQARGPGGCLMCGKARGFGVATSALGSGFIYTGSGNNSIFETTKFTNNFGAVFGSQETS